MKSLITCILFLTLLALSRAQPLSVLMSDGNASTCNGILYDTGGVGASGYSNGENYTLTICPDVPGDVITLEFLSYNLSTVNTATPPASNIDNMTIYDGNSTAAPSMGTYTGTQLQGSIVTCTSLNSSGCITLVFVSNSAGTGVFAATITCSTPCQRPTVVMSAPTVVANPQRICDGETINFNGSTSFPAPGFNIVDYVWSWGDGTTDTLPTGIVSHTFSTGPGEYSVNLSVIDDNNCISTNVETIKVQVGTVPTFTGTTTDQELCLGENICLDGVVNPTLYTGQPINSLGGATYLPDNVGQCFTATLDFMGFLPGQTLTNINDLLNICVSMEHSFMGDLVCTIYCPNGQSVITHQQNGSSTNLGDPDQMDDPNLPGTCWNYCWSPTATNGTWVDNSLTGTTPTTVINSSGWESLAPGTYESLNPLSALLGCPLNGTWTIEFCDLWGADDGFVCDWSVAFDPSLYPAITTFEPVYGNQCDSSSWTASSPVAASFVTSTSADCNQICVEPTSYGTFDYVYSVTDNFGCTYDTTITVSVVQGPTVDAGPDITVCSGVAAQLNAVASGGMLPAPGCDYTINMYDSFGDGWNGFTIEVFINGSSIGTYTFNTGTFSSATFPILDGDVISFSTVGGSWDSEVTYEIVDCQGNIVYTDGPNPALGGGVWSGTGVNPTPPNYNFLWTPTGGLSNPNIADPMVTVTNNMTYVVTVYETGHILCASTDTVQVMIDPAAYAGEDSVNTLCFNDPSFNMFSFLGGTPAATGSWFDASGVPVSNMFDPSVQSSGQYMYVVASGGICPNDTAVIDVTVLPPGAPGCGCNLNPSSVVTDVSCFGLCDGEIDITANSTEYSMDGGITFQSSGLFSGMCAGSYDVLIADSAFGPACVTTVSVVVTEPSLLTLDLTAIDAICFNACDGSMNAIVAGGTPPYVYAYSNGVGTPSNTNLCAGTYNLLVTDNNGCTQDTMNIEIFQNPEVKIDLLTATDETCFELCDGTIEVSGQNISEFSIDNGVNFSATGSYVNLCTGIYSVVVQDADGCRAYGNLAISGPPPVLAGFTFSPEETNVLQTNFSFTNTSQNAVTYEWFLANQLFSSEVNPEYSLPDQAGTYTVCLVATNLNGCPDTVCQEIIIDDILVVYVPNAFTPDGDNINETVVPVMQGYKTEGYRFQIFDRWGEMVFSSTEPGVGWNGTFKGFSAKTDVYVWKLQVVSVADNSTHSYTGHVTLIK